MHRPFFSILILLTCLLPQVWALSIDGYSSPENDRFVNDSGFIASVFDLSGIAISNDGRWVTLIAPNVFLTAQHFAPTVGQSIIFYQTNDPTGPSVTRNISSIRQRIGSSDLLLCTLDLPVPEGYTFYSYATESISNFNKWIQYPYRNQEVFHFGRSPSAFTISKDITVGKNVVDEWSSNQTVSSPSANGPAIFCQKNTTLGKIPYETIAQSGDSGAPLLWNDAGNGLRLIGIAWFITQDSVTGEANATGFSAVGSHASEIDTFINDNALAYQPLGADTFSGTRISRNQIDLSWQDRSAVETAYVLERSDFENGPWMLLAALGADSESYSDTSAPAGDVYYRLRAENDTASDYIATYIPSPYNRWAEDFEWGEADQSPNGDANSDGIVNLFAYSVNESPLAPLPEGIVPYLEVLSNSLDYFYRRNPDATDLSFTLLQTPDLENTVWQEVVIDGNQITQTNLGMVGNSQLIRIRMPIELYSNEAFFRIKITLDPLP